MNYGLRSYFRSSCSWRVRIVLAWKGLQADMIPVHLVQDGGEQHKEEHKALNPMRQLPVLLVGDQPISQSVAIMEYLEEVHPTPPLLPSSPLERARVREMVEVINSGIQPIQNLSVMQELKRKFEIDKEGTLGWSRYWITRGFGALETLVIQSHGRYSSGDQVTLADVCLVPQIYNARRFGVEMEAFPTLLKIEKELDAIEAFAAARPEVQGDFPG